MQHSLFFKISSFFFDREVETTSTLLNRELRVVLSNNRYQLNSGIANYSFGNLHTAFQRVFSHTNLKKIKINSALILGFGAGSVASILRNEIKSDCKITGVEIDSKVIDLAKKYFNLNTLNNCRIVVDDALNFVKNDSGKYDLIVVDLFSEIDVPSVFQLDSFLSCLHNRAADSALVYFNFVIDNESQKREFLAFEKRFQKEFPTSKTLTIMDSNKILLAHCVAG